MKSVHLITAAALVGSLAFGGSAIAAPPMQVSIPQSPAIKDDPAKVAAARDYIILTHPRSGPASIKERLDAMMPQMIASARATNPKLDPKKYEAETRATFMAEAARHLDAEAAVFSRHFTLAELKELVAINLSPVARKLSAEMPKIQVEMMALMRQMSGPGSMGAPVKMPPNGAPKPAKS